MGVLASSEAARPADEDKAIEKLRAAQYAFDAEGLLRWTEADIPGYAEEPMVLMAAFLSGNDFERPVDPTWPQLAMRLVATGVNLRTTSTVQADYF